MYNNRKHLNGKFFNRYHQVICLVQCTRDKHSDNLLLYSSNSVQRISQLGEIINFDVGR